MRTGQIFARGADESFTCTSERFVSRGAVREFISLNQKLMGNSAVSLTSVTEVRKSNHFAGNGLFATCDIPKGTVLKSDVHNTLANDADFKYPPDFSIEALTSCLKAHKEYENCSSNNITKYSELHDQVIRDIKKGQELTRRYKTYIWVGLIYFDIIGLNKYSSCNTCMLNEDEAQAVSNLKQAVRSIGYEITIRGSGLDTSIDFVDLNKV